MQLTKILMDTTQRHAFTMINIHNDVMMYFNHSLLTPTRILCKFLGFAIVTMILFVALTPALTASATLTTHTTHIVFVTFCAISQPPALPLHTWRQQQINSAIIHLVQTVAAYWICCGCKSACNGLLLLQPHCCCWLTAWEWCTFADWPSHLDPVQRHCRPPPYEDSQNMTESHTCWDLRTNPVVLMCWLKQ